ncbi:MAG: hypothetical protein ACRDCE_17215 [Cetobacterium sp.]|uniref:hypothetical protein n=1 Tax=Cetobacterium sp. TaxID=2071632 RepID=UPI003EE72309
MSIFKSQKFEKGLYTGFITIKGETKMKKGEAVTEEVEVGTDDFGQPIVEKKEVKNKSTFINLVRNYPEGEEPESYDDRESYLVFSSNRKDEADYVAKDDEKNILVEINYNEDTARFEGKLADGTEIVSEELKSTDRITQFNLKGEMPF